MERALPFAVLISGRGSNMLALASAAADGRIAGRVVTVICDLPAAIGNRKRNIWPSHRSDVTGFDISGHYLASDNVIGQHSCQRPFIFSLQKALHRSLGQHFKRRIHRSEHRERPCTLQCFDKPRRFNGSD